MKTDFDKIYTDFENALENAFDVVLDFVDRRRYPLLITASVHLLLVILICNVAFTFNTFKSVELATVSIEELQRIEDELKSPGQSQQTVDAKLDHSQMSNQALTNRAANLGVDEDMSKLRQRFSTLDEAKAVTKQKNDYGEDTEVDLFSEQVKLRDVDLDKYQKVRPDQTKSVKDGKVDKEIYTGKSTISFKLTGRYELQLPNPIYTCQSGGLVVVDIKVNRKGQVTSAQINNSESQTTNECLREAAVNYARRAVFNVDQGAEEPQTGTIAYLFQ